jgi:hypothetical protein
VSLGDLVADFLPGLREDAESLMVDECVIERPGVGKGPLDRATGKHTPPPRTLIYGPGPCEVKRPGAVRRVSAGDRLSSLEGVVVKVPVEVTGVDVGDRVTLTRSRDPALVGRELTVDSDPGATYAVTRRLQCTEVTSS